MKSYIFVLSQNLKMIDGERLHITGRYLASGVTPTPKFLPSAKTSDTRQPLCEIGGSNKKGEFMKCIELLFLMHNLKLWNPY